MNIIEQGYRNKNTQIKPNGLKSPAGISEAVGKLKGYYRPTEIFEKFQIGILTDNHLLAAQSRDVFTRLLPYLERVSFSENKSIYQPGDLVDYVYFPESAIMSEFHILEDGGTLEIAMTGREGVVGALSVFNNNPATNWTQVLVAGNALKIKSRILREEISRAGSSLQSKLFDCINVYIGQISQRAVCNIRHSLEQRFGSWLLMLARHKSGKLPLTQEQIARSLGVHRPSITHIAQSLRECGAIEYRRGSIFISSREKLEAYACGCYSEIDKNFKNIF